MTLRKWAAGIAAFVLLATFAVPALATTYYVNGSDPSSYGGISYAARDERAGTSSALAWGTLAKANATVDSGDVVILERSFGANYQDNIDPACQSSATGWVTYIGSLTYPGYATVTGGTISKPYVSVKGVAFTGNLDATSNRDSIQYCTVAGEVRTGLSDYCFFGSNRFNGSLFQQYKCVDASSDGSSCTYYCSNVPSRGNVFSDNRFTNLFSWPLPAENQFSVVGADSVRFLFNTFDINGCSQAIPSYYFVVKHSNYASFRGCRWNFNSLIGGGDEANAVILAVRDSVRYLSFDCDTMLSLSGEPVRARLVNEGNLYCDTGLPLSDANSHITWDSCYVHLKNSPYGLWAQSKLNQFTFTNNVVINENGAALTITNNLIGPNLFDHNTFIGTVSRENGFVFGVTEGGMWQDTTRVTNNIFYALDKADPLYMAGAVVFDATKYDPTFAATGTDHASHLYSDHNLYSYYGSSYLASNYQCETDSAEPAYREEPDTTGRRSIKFHTGWVGLGCGTQYAWPGRHPNMTEQPTYSATLTPFVGEDTTVAVTLTAGALLPNTIWSARWCPGCDDSSRYGSPAFADSSASDFNPTLGYGSLAAYGGSDSSAVGARAWTSPPMAVIDPASITFRIPVLTSSTQYDSVLIINGSSTDSLEFSVAGDFEAWPDGYALEAGGVLAQGDYEAGVKIGPGKTSYIAFSYFSYGYDPVSPTRQRSDKGTYRLRIITDDPVHPFIDLPITITE